MFLLILRMRQPPFAEPDRRSQFGQPSFARHPKLTQETTVSTVTSAEIGEASLANPVWRIYPLTELIILARRILKSKRSNTPGRQMRVGDVAGSMCLSLWGGGGGGFKKKGLKSFKMAVRAVKSLKSFKGASKHGVEPDAAVPRAEAYTRPLLTST